MGRLSTGQAPAPVVPKPPTPVIPAVPAIPATPAPIAVPPPSASGSGIGRKVLIGGLVLFSLFMIGLLISRLLGSNTPVQETPTPTVTPTMTLAPSKTLQSYFRVTGSPITLTSDATAKTDFANALATMAPTVRDALRIPVTTATMSTGFPSVLLAEVPTAIQSGFGTDWAILAYGQPDQGKPKAVMISEVSDATAATQGMSQWETTGLENAAAPTLGIDPAKAITEGFVSSAYRQITIRYWNFPTADTSIDWAVLTASNGKSYLIIAGSREAMFFTIDQLMQ